MNIGCVAVIIDNDDIILRDNWIGGNRNVTNIRSGVVLAQLNRLLFLILLLMQTIKKEGRVSVMICSSYHLLLAALTIPGRGSMLFHELILLDRWIQA